MNSNIRIEKLILNNFRNHKYLNLDINKVRPIERGQYVPRGQTALYDAIGNSLTYFMEKKLLDPESYSKCLMYIVTDGYENASKNFSSNKVKKLIDNAREKYSIDLFYLGANQDAILEASKIGIGMGHALNYSESSETCEQAYRSVANVANRQRSNQDTNFTQIERSISCDRRENIPNTPRIVRQTHCADGIFNEQ